ncbi:hypothetical protein BGP76_17375 [Reichenbachiella sp. MSK19-1]|nr:hypothetical protein BGP76_17375 [Reichenbachiella sp. MSK19-1]
MCSGLRAEEPYQPKVPTTMEFAGMKLKITEGARKEIQEDVDMLTRSEKYFELKADRARLYFPVIEKTLKEQNVPDDFKFLSVQESALISDAVSSANAVGFWQFKDFTGREVGLRIDRNVDERLNIVSSTIGAAKYFKRHNFYFNNWIYTLLAHMTGRGGAAKYVDEKQFGATRMTIDRKTHWYVKRCLAHKIAFEEAMKRGHSQGMKLLVYERGGGKTLSKIADELKVSETELKQYNKWLKTSKIPDDKTYTVVVPVTGKLKSIDKINGGVEKHHVQKSEKSDAGGTAAPVVIPSLSAGLNTQKNIFIKINGLPTILAQPGDDVQSLSEKAALHPERLAKYNDITVGEAIQEGEVYYLRAKRNRGRTYYYTALPGETMWEISQKFGIKEKRLARMNRMMTIDPIKAGRVMWLRNRRPKDQPVEIRELSTAPVDETIPVKELIREEKKAEKLAEKKEQEIIEKAIQEEEVDEQESTPLEEDAVDEVKDEKVEAPEELPTFMEVGEPESDKEPTPVDEAPRKEKKTEDRNYFTHEVTKGETLYSLSKKYGVSVEDIKEWNDLYDVGLSLGQTLIIHGEGRAFEMKPKEVDFHVVEPGETLYGISKKYNIPIQDLLRINQKDNFALSVGERIRVKE